MKVISLTIIAFFSVVSVFGQASSEKTAVCSADKIEKISSRGIQVGAKVGDILNTFASTEEEKNQIRRSASGPDRTNIGYEFFAASPKAGDKRFEGISHYGFEFLDGELISLSVHYEKPKWQDVNQFTEKVIEIFNLPKIENWTKQNPVSNTIQCGDYKIDLSLTGIGSALNIYNVQTGKILEQREQKLEAKKREIDIREFKP